MSLARALPGPRAHRVRCRPSPAARHSLAGRHRLRPGCGAHAGCDARTAGAFSGRLQHVAVHRARRRAGPDPPRRQRGAAVLRRADGIGHRPVRVLRRQDGVLLAVRRPREHQPAALPVAVAGPHLEGRRRLQASDPADLRQLADLPGHRQPDQPAVRAVRRRPGGVARRPHPVSVDARRQLLGDRTVAVARFLADELGRQQPGAHGVVQPSRLPTPVGVEGRARGLDPPAQRGAPADRRPQLRVDGRQPGPGRHQGVRRLALSRQRLALHDPDAGRRSGHDGLLPRQQLRPRHAGPVPGGPRASDGPAVRAGGQGSDAVAEQLVRRQRPLLSGRRATGGAVADPGGQRADVRRSGAAARQRPAGGQDHDARGVAGRAPAVRLESGGSALRNLRVPGHEGVLRAGRNLAHARQHGGAQRGLLVPLHAPQAGRAVLAHPRARAAGDPARCGQRRQPPRTARGRAVRHHGHFLGLQPRVRMAAVLHRCLEPAADQQLRADHGVSQPGPGHLPVPAE